MKKIIVCLVVATFALLPAAQAGEGKAKAKNTATSAVTAKSACTDECSTASGDKAKTTLTSQKSCATSCDAKNTVTRKSVKPAEKGGMMLAKR